MTGVVAKHEFSAVTMADGYARSTSGLGVVAATSGGGAMNLVAGLAESYTSRVPVLALVGQPPTALEGHGAFQDSSGRAGSIDAVRLFPRSPATARGSNGPRTRRAAAPGGRRGPAAAGRRCCCYPRMCSRPVVPLPRFTPPTPDRADDDRVGLARVAEMIAAARRDREDRAHRR